MPVRSTLVPFLVLVGHLPLIDLPGLDWLQIPFIEDCLGGEEEECVPITCEEAGRACGTEPDHCGGTLECPSCGAGEVCNQNVGICIPGEEPPPGGVVLRCGCWDRTRIDVCTVNSEYTCGSSNASHACDVVCKNNGGRHFTECRGDLGDRCEPAYLPDFGTTQVSCDCTDGTLIDACAILECADRADFCDTACARNGDAVFAACEEDSGACTGAVPPPAGDQAVRCDCNDGVRIDHCTTMDCNDPADLYTLCASSCALHGGTAPLDRGPRCFTPMGACRADYDPPWGTTQVTCACGDGSTVDACAQTACDDAVGFCDLACHDRGGGWPGSCELQGPRCMGREPPPPGPQGFVCRCAQGTEVPLCVEAVDCWDSESHDEICLAACQLLGGWTGTHSGCTSDPTCSAP